MRISGIALALAAAFSVHAQTPAWDFENNDFRGWSQTGQALAGQPVCKKASDAGMPSERFADSRLGGDYWKGLAYPLGQHGNCVVTSLARTIGSRPWSLTSPEFAVPGDAPFLSFLIGGTHDPVLEHVEFQVRRGADWVVLHSATGPGGEQLRQEVFEIPAGTAGMTGRVVITDNSPSGHITVDYIRFTAERPVDVNVPVWGYADYHTHPMTHLAFGSTGDRQIIWGKPGGDYDDYVKDPHLISKDIPECVRGHGGGYLAEAFINNAQLFSDSIGSIVKAFLFPHERSGGPDFDDFPNWAMGAHEQMHVTMIRRNYEGGLRLMVALVTDNWGAGFLTGVTKNGQVNLVSERATITAQMNGLRELAANNCSWMEIALTPADARRIILQNKLAIVPGVELDRLDTEDPDHPDKEVDWLWNQGVRAVTPIHAVDNNVGSPAILNGPYNWLNDFFAHNATQVRPKQLPPAQFFQVEGDDCNARNVPHGECVMFHLNPSPQLRLVISRPVFTLFRRAPGFVVVKEPFDTGDLGQKNKNGLNLKTKGPDYIRALMKRGMILDTAHMSDKSLIDTYDLLEKRPGYPAVVSHAHFRAEGLYDDPKNNADYMASEYDISDSNLANVKKVGGVVGPFMHQARINPDSIDIHISHITDDCGDSSKGFAFAFHYAQERVPGGVGMATDMTFIPLVAPRFGSEACEGYKSTEHGQRRRSAHPEHYVARAQKDPVLYNGIPAIRNTSINQRDPLTPYIADGHPFDFNTVGLAHFGLVPDMLQDLKNVEMPKRDFQALFGSAEGYLEMWERVERAAR